MKRQIRLIRLGTPLEREEAGIKGVPAVKAMNKYYWLRKEHEAWCKDMANKYVESVTDVSIQESIAWLEVQAEKTIDILEKQKFIDLVKNKTSWSVWEKAVKEADKVKQMRLQSITVRGISTDLYKQARARAIQENKNIGQWINEAIGDKLHH